MIAADLALRWAHILGAAILVGGTIFMRCAWSSADNDEAAAVRSRWAKLVMIASGLLLISGFANFALIMQRFEISKDGFPGQFYHMLFGIKFLLALGVFFLSSVLAGRSSLAEKLRQKESTWLTVNMWLAIAVVMLAGMMKLADRETKSADSTQPAAHAAGRAAIG